MSVSIALGLAWYAIISVIDAMCPSHAAQCSAYTEMIPQLAAWPVSGDSTEEELFF